MADSLCGFDRTMRTRDRVFFVVLWGGRKIALWVPLPPQGCGTAKTRKWGILGTRIKQGKNR